MPPPLLLRQHIHLRHKLGMRRNRPRQTHHLPPLHLILPNPPQQQTDIVPRLRLIQQLPEHLHPGHHRLTGRTNPHHLHLSPHRQLPLLHPARHHRPPPSNRKHILNRHLERLIHRPRRQRHKRIQRLQQLQHRLLMHRIPLQSQQRRPPHHRHLIPRKLILRQQIPNLQLHQIQQLRIIHQIHLIQIHHNTRHPHLPRQQHMLPRLRHRPIIRPHHQHRPIHLRRPRNHVLNVISMPRHIHMRIMTSIRLILHMRNRNRNPPLLLLRSLINLIKRRIHHLRIPRRQHLRNRRRQRRLPMINMTHRPHIHMRLRTLKPLLTHGAGLLLGVAWCCLVLLVLDCRLLSYDRSGGWIRTTDYPIMSRVLCH